MFDLSATGSRSLVGYVSAQLFVSLLAKVVVTRFFFDYPIVVLLLQTAVTLFILEILRVTGAVQMAAYTLDKGRQVIIPSLLLCFAQWITIASLEGIGLPELESVKRLTPLIIVGILMGSGRLNNVDKKNIFAVVAVSISAFIAVNLEYFLDRYSIIYGIIACVLQAIAYVQLENLSQHFQAVEMLYLHSFNSLVFFLVLDVIQDEVRDSFMYMMTSAHPLFVVVFVMLLLSAVLLQYATFACIHANGALTTQITSNIRAAIQIFIAYFLNLYLFYDTYPGFLNYLALIGTFVAGFYFFKTRHEENGCLKTPWVTKC